jgi:RHS repeat-associated protein
VYAHHFLNYLSGGAMLVNLNGVETLYYGYTDNQGSLIVLTDINGNWVEKYAYDPWGARRNPDDWRQKDNRSSFITNRGYTGHEHLDMFNIINMNGRVYDPLTAMFFSPDPFIQSAGDWKNYNRYSYCLNNPTRYTDPSGYQQVKQYEDGNNSPWSIFDQIAQTERRLGISNGGIGGSYEFKTITKNYLYWNFDRKDEGKYEKYHYYTRTLVSRELVWVPNPERSLHNIDNFASKVGFVSDVFKATGLLGSIGFWKDNWLKIRPYWNGWTGNKTVKTFGTASLIGYGMYGISTIANLGLSLATDPDTGQPYQSWGVTGISISINTIMLRMPLQVGIGYWIGSTTYSIQQSAFKTLINQGYSNNPGLFNTDFLH